MQIGDTFQGPHRDPSYWSLRYDFKPASVNSDAPGTLRVGADNQVLMCVCPALRKPYGARL